MYLSNRTLGIIGMICAPFFFLDIFYEMNYSRNHTWSGTTDMIYMIGWAASIIGLLRLNAAGKSKYGKRLLVLNLIFLALASVWNIWYAIAGDSDLMIYRFFDIFWPGSNCLLFVTGIVIAINGTLKGIARYAPLLAGCWLPVVMIFSMLMDKFSSTVGMIAGGYSLITWFLMAFVIYRSERSAPEKFYNNLSLN